MGYPQKAKGEPNKTQTLGLPHASPENSSGCRQEDAAQAARKDSDPEEVQTLREECGPVDRVHLDFGNRLEEPKARPSVRWGQKVGWLAHSMSSWAWDFRGLDRKFKGSARFGQSA